MCKLFLIHVCDFGLACNLRMIPSETFFKADAKTWTGWRLLSKAAWSATLSGIIVFV